MCSVAGTRMDFSLGVQDCVRCSRADWGNASVVACLCGRRQLGPCLLWNREGSPAHRCGAVSLMNFTDMVRLLAEQPLRHYASLDCAVPRVEGGRSEVATVRRQHGARIVLTLLAAQQSVTGCVSSAQDAWAKSHATTVIVILTESLTILVGVRASSSRRLRWTTNGHWTVDDDSAFDSGLRRTIGHWTVDSRLSWMQGRIFDASWRLWDALRRREQHARPRHRRRGESLESLS